jgi:hypothetical protein
MKMNRLLVHVIPRLEEFNCRFVGFTRRLNRFRHREDDFIRRLMKMNRLPVHFIPRLEEFNCRFVGFTRRLMLFFRMLLRLK